MKKVFSSILIVTGLVLVAGSANDCDGACMDTANTLGEMLIVASIGLAMLATGALILISNTQEG